LQLGYNGILMKKEGSANRKDPVKNTAGPFKNLLRSIGLINSFDKRYLVYELTLRLITGILPFVAAWYSAVFLNKVATGNFTSIFDPALIAVILIYVTLPFFVDASKVVQQGVRQKFYIFFSQWLDIHFMDKKTTVDIQTYEDPTFSDKTTRIKENFYKLGNTIDWFFDIWEGLIKVIIAFCVVAAYKWWIGVAILIALLPDMYVERKYGHRIWGIWDARASIKRRYYELGSHFDKASDLIEMKVSGTKDFLKKGLEMLSSQFNNERGQAENKRIRLKLSTTLFLSLITAAIIMVIMRDLLNGTLIIGTFTFILSSMYGLRGDLSETLRGISTLSADNRYVNDIHEFLATKNILKNGSIQLGDGTPGIEFENVAFAYPGSEKSTGKGIFEKINFVIKPGEKIAIVGVNGAGKTTLTKLLMRFYDPTGGVVRIGGHDAREIDISSYYKKIGYLSQEYDKFKMITKDSIAIGDTSIQPNLPRVMEAAKKAGAHEFISAWPYGYDTQLGNEFEGGVQPSIGQWQKLALARLFYRDPQIWILDEPTASIDAVAEMEVFQELEKLPDDRTVILISHRFNTVKNADRIMVIEHGEIREFGSHHQLMAIKNGVYHKLFTAQKDSFGD
jgi:ATP-binding cassette subfamily B protein